jgi:WD40 repeat protein
MKNIKSLIPLFLLIVILLPYPIPSLNARTQQYAMCGGDKDITYWTIPEGSLIRTFIGHTYYLWDVTISSDGYNALTCDHRGDIKYWRISDATCLFTHRKHG